MTAALILNQAQAEAVYSAMCALNNVGGIEGDLTLNEGLRVQWLECVTVRDGLFGPREEYADQSDFATAYGLNRHGEDGEADQGYADGYAGRPMAMCMKSGRYATQYRRGEADSMKTAGNSQSAHGLGSDEPQSAVAAAAGGLTQTAIER